VDGGNANANSVETQNNASNNLLNRMLIEHGGADFESQVAIFTGDSNTIQSTVSRYTRRAINVDIDCFQIDKATNTRLVNNETYGCYSKAVYLGAGGAPGTIVENNDLYVSTEQFTDCRGNFTPSDPNAS